ncbi:tetratricopeptide repeat protein [Phormidium sp. LEGE 05292]|uniref:tetratricopeptide repeat protein n=1 Tax=[Phormidium] sp. LEGE 05292 TaxID=767427 RepID=UPI001882D7C3|nr:tetratricopeptide repeat protein [Phormidium sp. LEGE 05292]MBE9226722.1 tetratricopeptide repeat protein [Phormidium sp. LEGE 05292]
MLSICSAYFASNCLLKNEVIYPKLTNSSTNVSVEQYFCRGKRDYFNYKLGSALTNFYEALRRNPHYANIYFYRGNTYVLLGDLPNAIANYNFLLRLKPDFPNAHLVYANRGTAYARSKNYRAAIADYTQSIRLNSSTPLVRENRGFANYFLGYNQAAIADFLAEARLFKFKFAQMMELIEAVRNKDESKLKTSWPIVPPNKGQEMKGC